MSTDRREAIQEANRRRGNCQKCGASGGSLDRRDGSEIGGMPGITYKVCNGCGWSQAQVKRPRRFKL